MASVRSLPWAIGTYHTDTSTANTERSAVTCTYMPTCTDTGCWEYDSEADGAPRSGCMYLQHSTAAVGVPATRVGCSLQTTCLHCIVLGAAADTLGEWEREARRHRGHLQMLGAPTRRGTLQWGAQGRDSQQRQGRRGAQGTFSAQPTTLAPLCPADTQLHRDCRGCTFGDTAHSALLMPL